MPRTFTDEELGLDMSMKLQTCDCCRKESDGAIRFEEHGVWYTMCGTHYDEYRILHIRTGEGAASYVKRLREGKYKACWDAKLDDGMWRK